MFGTPAAHFTNSDPCELSGLEEAAGRGLWMMCPKAKMLPKGKFIPTVAMAASFLTSELPFLLSSKRILIFSGAPQLSP